MSKFLLKLYGKKQIISLPTHFTCNSCVDAEYDKRRHQKALKFQARNATPSDVIHWQNPFKWNINKNVCQRIVQ